MKKVLTLAASTSSKSINARLVSFAAQQLIQITPVDLITLHLKDYDMPLFCEDRKLEFGVPEPAQRFKQQIQEADGILISFAEHNGSYTAAFKNLLDWTSVLEGSMWYDKPMCLLATSPGGRGGLSVLTAASDRFPRMNGRVISSFSLPSFEDHFTSEMGISNPQLLSALTLALQKFSQAL